MACSGISHTGCSTKLVDIEEIVNDGQLFEEYTGDDIDDDEVVPNYMVPGDFTRNEKIDIVGADIQKPLKFEENQEKMREFIQDLCSHKLDTKEIAMEAKKLMSKKHRIMPSHANMIYTYRCMIQEGLIKQNFHFERHFRSKTFRAKSGVMVITVVSSPGTFSCKFDCHYCPNEPAHEGNGFQAQPRSYIFNEPGVRRANRNGFDAVLQVRDRARSYIINGLPVDKIEIIVLGGTWHSYPKDYRYEFIRDLFYAANTLYDEDFNESPRPKLDIREEHRINESAKARIIGVTSETRPDQITPETIEEMRYQGVTRVQLGVQHTDDEILRIINRRCPTKTTIKAIKMLKDNCFKVDIHLMPDLPGSDYEKDMKMFQYILESEDLQADQWKIYPCMTIPWTKIKEW